MSESQTITIDNGQRIAEDRLCFQCGYNLRTISLSGLCPECGAPAARSQPLWTRTPQLLHRLRFAAVALPICAICAAFSDEACGWLLRRIAPSSVMAMFNLPVGATVRIHPWQPWAGILTQVLSAVLIGFALIALYRLSHVCAETGVVSQRGHRVISRMAMFAGALTSVGVVADTVWKFGISAGHSEFNSVIWFAANTSFALLAICAFDCAYRLQGLVHRAWQRYVARALWIVSLPIGFGRIAGFALSLAGALVVPPYPVPYVAQFPANEGLPTYMIVRFDGTVSRTATAPADQLARTQHLTESFRIGGAAMSFYQIEQHIAKWTHWPWYSLMLVLSCLVSRTGWDAHRALRRPRTESPRIADGSR